MRPFRRQQIPGPFWLDDADALARLLRGAGLADVTVAEVPTPSGTSSFDEWWTVVPSLAGPIATVLAHLPAETRQEIRDNAEVWLGPCLSADGDDIPGLSLVAAGHVP